MRRTDQEFKAEVMRRSSAYKARRKKRMKQVLTTASCAAVIIMTLGIFLPSAFGGSMNTADSAAPENMMSMQNAASPESAEDCEAPAEQEPESDSNYGAGEEQSLIQVFSIADENFAELSSEDAAILLPYLDLEGDWAEASTNCASDYILNVDGQTIYYHSECGTFIDMSAYRSRTVEEETRLTINAILEAYIELENYD